MFLYHIGIYENKRQECLNWLSVYFNEAAKYIVFCNFLWCKSRRTMTVAILKQVPPDTWHLGTPPHQDITFLVFTITMLHLKVQQCIIEWKWVSIVMTQILGMHRTMARTGHDSLGSISGCWFVQIIMTFQQCYYQLIIPIGLELITGNLAASCDVV